ncbi:MAG: methyl-accepting chemotaxis protein [Rhodospirillales bacterium]|nr:methyl-accepting chemotaxis protein [Rhodospirillales bacterium]
MISRFLNNLSVGTRLYILVGLALAAIAGAALLFAATDRKLELAFEEHSVSARIQELSYRIEVGISRLRSHQSTYLLNNDPQAMDGYARESAKLVAFLQTLGSIPEAAEIRNRADTLSDGIAEHATEFRKIADLDGMGPAARGADLERLARYLTDEIEARFADLGFHTPAAGALALLRDESELMAGRPEAVAELARKRLEVFDPLLWRAPLSENERMALSDSMDAYVSTLLDLGEWNETKRVAIARMAEIVDYLMPGVEALGEYRRHAANAVLAAEAKRAQARSLMLIGAGVVFVVFAALGVILVLGVSVPIRGLADAAYDLAQGNREAFIPDRETADEVGDISRALRKTRSALIDAEMRERAGAVREQSAIQVSKEGQIALANDIEQRIGAAASGLADAAAQLRNLADTLGNMTSEASRRTDEMTAASGETKDSLRKLAGVALSLQNGEADQAVAVLPAIEKDVGERLKKMSDVALRARLMALNGVIAAARNGNGSGFGDIAQRVKEISERFAADVTDFQARISNVLAPIDEIAGAADAQGAALREIMRNAENAVAGTLQLSNSVSRITRNTGETEKVAGEILVKADAAARQSETLLGEIGDILAQIRR